MTLPKIVFDEEDFNWLRSEGMPHDADLTWEVDDEEVKKGRSIRDLLKAEWEENKHPRAKDGKFGNKNGGDAPKSEHKKPIKVKEKSPQPVNTASGNVRTTELPQEDSDAKKRALSFTSEEGKAICQKYNLTREQIMKKIEGAREIAKSTPSTIEKHIVGEVDKNNPDWREKSPIDPMRIMVYNEYIDAQLGKAEPLPAGQVPKLLVTGGLPGSGKSTMLGADVYKEQEETSVRIDADLIRNHLAKVDGLEHAGIRAASYQDETDRVIEILFDKAVANNYNVIYDSTMKTPDRLIAFVDKFKESGGKTEIAYAELPLEKAITRAVSRFLNPESGRFVDPDYVVTHDHKNLRTLELMKSKVDSWRHWNTDVPHGSPAVMKGEG